MVFLFVLSCIVSPSPAPFCLLCFRLGNLVLLCFVCLNDLQAFVSCCLLVCLFVGVFHFFNCHYPLPEFPDFQLLGKTISVAKNKFRPFLTNPLDRKLGLCRICECSIGAIGVLFGCFG